MIGVMSDFIATLAQMPRTRRRFSAGQLLFEVGDPVVVLHFIDDGCLQLVRRDAEGGGAVVQRAGVGAILAESSIFSEHYHCAGEAVTDTRISQFRMSHIRERLNADAGFAAQLAAYLARQVQGLRGRAEMLSRKTVSQRLDCWLALNGGEMPPKGAWNLLANDLAVTPEALYRELQRRRER